MIIIVVHCLCIIVIWFLRTRWHFCVCKFEVFRGVDLLCNISLYHCKMVSLYIWGFSNELFLLLWSVVWSTIFLCVLVVSMCYIFFPIKIATVLLGESIFTIWIFQYEIGLTVWFVFSFHYKNSNKCGHGYESVYMSGRVTLPYFCLSNFFFYRLHF